MQSLKANQYVIQNGKLVPKGQSSENKNNFRQIPYQHTLRKGTNTILYDI